MMRRPLLSALHTAGRRSCITLPAANSLIAPADFVGEEPTLACLPVRAFVKVHLGVCHAYSQRN
jgi:hypothetical protein